MNTNVRIRKRQDPVLWSVYQDPDEDLDLDFQNPDLTLTRIWMGVVPPESTSVRASTGAVERKFSPGYACVVGEVYDRDPMQKERERIILDEGVCLDPADFTLEARNLYGIRPDERKNATLTSLRQAVVALKDLWLPEKIMCPQDNDRFYRFIQNTEGLWNYDSRYGDHYYKERMPFFVSRRWLSYGVVQVKAEDREYNMHLVDSLLSQNRLIFYDDLTLFYDEKLHTSYRAAGMVLAEMQLFDMTYAVRDYEIGDGYAVENPQDMDNLREEMDEDIDTLEWWAGVSEENVWDGDEED
jgi:hypothetical protein